MPAACDGPATSLFSPLPIRGNTSFSVLAKAGISDLMKAQLDKAPRGACTCWGIPFAVKRPVLLKDKAVSVSLDKVRAPWLVFMHTADVADLAWNEDGLLSPTHGEGRLGEHIADYVVCYADGSEERAAIRRRRQIGMFTRRWGELCFEAVGHRKSKPARPMSEQSADGGWGWTQTRVANPDGACWINWLWAWENPHPRKAVIGLRFEPVSGVVLISGVSAGKVSSMPLRWQTRRKAVWKLPKGVVFDPKLDERGLLDQIQLDMGQVISAQPRTIYPSDQWAKTYNNQVPQVSEREVVVEYAAHPDACFHVLGKRVPAAKLDASAKAGPFIPIAPATRRVRLRAVEKGSTRPVAVKLHVHGEAGEYLAPVDRHRIPNGAWFEDYSCDFLNEGTHFCTYIDGETTLDLPMGRVYLEVSKGLEIKPVRKVVKVTRSTKEITVTIEKVLPWRERGLGHGGHPRPFPVAVDGSFGGGGGRDQYSEPIG